MDNEAINEAMERALQQPPTIPLGRGERNIAGIEPWTMDMDVSVALIVQLDHSKQKDRGSLCGENLDVII